MRAHNIKLETHLAEQLPAVIADQHQLQQVLVNIIQNARQAMSMSHGRGRLEITTEEGPTRFAAQEDNQRRMVRICFQDDGPGVPADIMGRIFDPFFTTKPDGSGTGLGLSICHGIISEHGGQIWAESGPGEGARFIIELPVALDGEFKKATRTAEKGTGSLSLGSRVLILDDEPNIQDVLAQALRHRGYTVDTASNATDGMLRIADMKYDVILCDIRMPEFSGLEFYRRVEAWQPEQAKKIVFITGDTANKATQEFIEEYGVQYLTKPFELADLLQMIRQTSGKP
jgi:two-component system NtrC family sensor kinase